MATRSSRGNAREGFLATSKFCTFAESWEPEVLKLLPVKKRVNSTRDGSNPTSAALLGNTPNAGTDSKASVQKSCSGWFKSTARMPFRNAEEKKSWWPPAASHDATQQPARGAVWSQPKSTARAKWRAAGGTALDSASVAQSRGCHGEALNRLENVTPPFPSRPPTPVSQEHGLLVQVRSSWRTALARRCFMLVLDVISSAVRTGHWEKPGIYCSSHNFLATSLLSPPPARCREIKFQ